MDINKLKSLMLYLWTNVQLMHYIVCYNKQANPIIIVHQMRCQKGLIIYFKTNDITFMIKHVEVQQFNLAQKVVEEMNNTTTTY